jgi:hypothetical protein
VRRPTFWVDLIVGGDGGMNSVAVPLFWLFGWLAGWQVGRAWEPNFLFYAGQVTAACFFGYT